jgi:hypothetical protein
MVRQAEFSLTSGWGVDIAISAYQAMAVGDTIDWRAHGTSGDAAQLRSVTVMIWRMD